MYFGKHFYTILTNLQISDKMWFNQSIPINYFGYCPGRTRIYSKINLGQNSNMSVTNRQIVQYFSYCRQIPKKKQEIDNYLRISSHKPQFHSKTLKP